MASYRQPLHGYASTAVDDSPLGPHFLIGITFTLFGLGGNREYAAYGGSPRQKKQWPRQEPRSEINLKREARKLTILRDSLTEAQRQPEKSCQRSRVKEVVS